MSGLVQARWPVEGPGTLIDDADVQSKAPVLSTSLVQEAAGEPAADAEILVVEVDLDPRQVGFGRPVSTWSMPRAQGARHGTPAPAHRCVPRGEVASHPCLVSDDSGVFGIG